GPDVDQAPTCGARRTSVDARQAAPDGALRDSQACTLRTHPTANSGPEWSQTGMSCNDGTISDRRVSACHRLNCLLGSRGQGQGRTADLSLLRMTVQDRPLRE